MLLMPLVLSSLLLAAVAFSTSVAGRNSSVRRLFIAGALTFAALWAQAQSTPASYPGLARMPEGTQPGGKIPQAYAAAKARAHSTRSADTAANPLAATPVLSPASGSYASSQSVTITDSTPGATIYYTTNGAMPTTSSAQYSGSVAVSASTTVVAIAVASGYATSAVANETYFIQSAPSSFIYTVAGNQDYGFSGDGGPATAADLNYPQGIVSDKDGNLYIGDSFNNVIRKVTRSTGFITTVAGTGIAGYSGDGGPATSATLQAPQGLSLDGLGNLYFADLQNNVVRMIVLSSGTIATVAGTGTFGFGGDGGPATAAQLGTPVATACDSAGNLYIAESNANRIRKVTVHTGTISTVAGNTQSGYSGDGGQATDATLAFPMGVAVDAQGDIYIADTYNSVIRKVAFDSNLITTVAGIGSNPASSGIGGYSGDGGAATSAQLNYPTAVAIDSGGNLFIVDTENQAIRKVTTSTGIITTFAGVGGVSPCFSYGGDGGSATSTSLCFPYAASVDQVGNIYIAEASGSRIREITTPAFPPTGKTAVPIFNVPAGTYATPQFATVTDATPGAGVYITVNDFPASVTAPLYNGPFDISGNDTIKAIAVAPGFLPSSPVTAAYVITSPPAFVMTTYAGTGVEGFSGAGGAAIQAQIGASQGAAFDQAGNFYFTDTSNNVVWMVSAQTSTISVVAGNGSAGYAGDGGPATAAKLNAPASISFDLAGNMFIADKNNNLIRMVAAKTGVITTYAGFFNSGTGPETGDGGPATSASLFIPSSVVCDRAGNVYIADTNDNSIRKVTASTGIITTIAGSGSGPTASGDGGQATQAIINAPTSLAIDSADNLYVGSENDGRVRKIIASTGIITTVAGNGNRFGDSGDGGLAIDAEVFPFGLAVDSDGDLYISNGFYSVREVSAKTGVITRFAGSGYGGTIKGTGEDGSSATVAPLSLPQGIALDHQGSLYIADQEDYRIRKVIAFQGQTATPTFSPAAGTYTTAQTVAITDTTPGAIIYYTTDGSTPSITSSTYTSPISVTSTETLSAIAVAPGYSLSGVATAAYVVQPLVAASVTVTPSATIIETQQSVAISVAVAGSAGQAVPTGSITLSSGTFSAQQSLAAGAASFTIPAGTLSQGTDAFTATYSGDATYLPMSSSASITVVQITLSIPAPASISPGGTATTTATLSPGSAYSGTMNFACSLTASPTAAQSLPTCSLSPTSVVVAAGSSGTTAVTMHTTAASTSAVRRVSSSLLPLAGGGTVLSFALLIGVPARRRRIAIFMMLMALATVGAIGCGGGGNGATPPIGPVTPATTAGNYTFTITGTDSMHASITVSANVTVTVQ